MKISDRILLLFCTLIMSLPAMAQEEQEQVFIQGKRYLDINLRAKERTDHHIQKQQDRLLKKLRKQERRYACRLQHTDSAGYAQYKQQPLTFDSISQLNKNDTSAIYSRSKSKSQESIDSLKCIKKYLEDKGQVFGKSNELTSYRGKLHQLEQKQGKHATINELIDRRTNFLKGLSNKKDQEKSLTAMQKQVFYSKGRMNAWKEISEEPGKAEERALEFLRGQEDFGNYLKQDAGAANATDIQKMGFQTKKQLEAQLRQRFGGDLSGIQKNITGQVKEFDKYSRGITDIKNKAQRAGQSMQKAKYFKKPAQPFKVNPMKGQPFINRIENQFGYQTTRPTQGVDPAMIHLSAMAGFKHTPNLSYGAGIATSIGLGQNWSNIKFSFEGIGLRTYIQWKWQYGFGAYVGYERTYKMVAFTGMEEKVPNRTIHAHDKASWNESLLIGVTKNYRINDKWSGGIQVLYDIWWMEKQLRTPVQLRFITEKTTKR